MKIINIIVFIILIISLESFANETQNNLLLDSNQYKKIYSANLLKSINDKINSKTSLFHNCFIYFIGELKPGFTNSLVSLGCIVHNETFIPSIGSHQYSFCQVTIHIDSLKSILDLESVKLLADAETLLYPQSNISHKEIKMDSVESIGYNGKGIKVAILDSGFDIKYKNNEIISVSNTLDYSEYPTRVDTDVENQVTGHGTHVVGCALASGLYSITNNINGSGAYKGSSSGANLIFLKIGNDINAAATDAALQSALSAAHQTFSADVISLSYGSYSEYQDGSSAVEQTVDFLVSEGVAVFCSAGNDRKSATHYSEIVESNNESKFIEFNMLNTDNVTCNILWRGNSQSNNTEVRLYDTDFNELDYLILDNVTTSQRGTFSQLCEVQLPYTISTEKYYLKIRNNNSENIHFHIYTDMEKNFKFINPDSNYTTLKPANADSAFSVGSYSLRKAFTNTQGDVISENFVIGSVSDFSSIGPRIDGLQKPDIIAPGKNIISLKDKIYSSTNKNSISDFANSTSSHYYTLSGTSMSTPIVAGSAATILSRNSTLKPYELYKLLRNNATKDSIIGFNSNSISGFGKLNVYKTITDLSIPKTINAYILNDNICDNNNFIVKIETQTVFSSLNQFTVLISDKNGNFNNARTLQQITSDTTRFFECSIPIDFTSGNSYRVKVVSSSPNIESSIAPNQIKYSNFSTAELFGDEVVCRSSNYRYSAQPIDNCKILFKIENGVIHDSSSSAIDVVWGLKSELGTVNVLYRDTISNCEHTVSKQIRIKPAIKTFIGGDSLICDNQIVSYSTAVKPGEYSMWKIYNGKIIDSTENSIVVDWENKNGKLELIVTDDTCIANKKINIINLKSPEYQLQGDFSVYADCQYTYKLKNVTNIKDSIIVYGGIKEESIENGIFSITWNSNTVGLIKIFRKLPNCSLELEYEVNIKDSLGFTIIGDDNVCLNDISHYKINQKVKGDVDIITSKGNVIINSDSTFSIQWFQTGATELQVTKKITKFNYHSLKKILVNIFKREQITIDSLPEFCKSQGRMLLNFAKPVGGVYKSHYINDNIIDFGKIQSGTINVKYIYPPASHCQDSLEFQIKIKDSPEKPTLNFTGVYLIADGNSEFYNWFLNDTLIFEKTIPKLFPDKPGIYSVRAVGDNGCESEFSNPIKVDFSRINEDYSIVNIYPNPVDDIFYIAKMSNMQNIINAQIFNSFGKIIKEIMLSQDIEQIDLSNEPAGLYFVKINQQNSFYILKIISQP